MNRSESIRQATNEEYDICVIGGGITGAGILANLMERGYRAVLIEKSDFASGTSSRSSKLIHGGLRYLQYAQFKLVYEAVHERGNLLKLYPHLVKPVPFLLPSFASGADLVVKDIALSFYDWMAGKSIIPHHIKLNAQQVLAKLPGLLSKNLKGGIYYWDAWTNDARLTLEVLYNSALEGATVINYMEATDFVCSGDIVTSVKCRDKITGDEVSIRAKIFINATGAWTDVVLSKLGSKGPQKMKPTKGVHAVISSKKLPAECVAVVTSQSGIKRFLYTLPWEHGLTILGATDTDYSGSSDKVECTEADIKYILDAFNAGFPEANLTTKDVVCVFAGLRPLLNAEGNIYSRSREYEIWWSKRNFTNIAGGKLTSFLSMGKHCLDVIEKKFGNFGHTKKDIAQLVPYKGYWSQTYGNSGKLIEDIVAESVENTQPISKNFPYTKAEIIFFTRHHFAQQLEDMLTRRTSITYAMKDPDEGLIENVALIMAKELGRDTSWIEDQKHKYHQHWLEYHPLFLNPTV